MIDCVCLVSCCWGMDVVLMHLSLLSSISKGMPGRID